LLIPKVGLKKQAISADPYMLNQQILKGREEEVSLKSPLLGLTDKQIFTKKMMQDPAQLKKI